MTLKKQSTEVPFLKISLSLKFKTIEKEFLVCHSKEINKNISKLIAEAFSSKTHVHDSKTQREAHLDMKDFFFSFFFFTITIAIQSESSEKDTIGSDVLSFLLNSFAKWK